MDLDLQTVLALYTMRERTRRCIDDDLLCDTEEETCAECGGVLFEDENDPFTLSCPDSDLVPH
ncbi:MAG: hypothetical protein ACRD3E_06050 [Terriglobales bacterium]